jgi:protein TonB
MMLSPACTPELLPQKEPHAHDRSEATVPPPARQSPLAVVRKLSNTRFDADGESDPSGRGIVVARLIVARDGGLVDVSLTKDSGSAALDRSVVSMIRKAAPFPPLPAQDASGSFSFIVPINYARQR